MDEKLPTISGNSIVVVARDQVSCDLAGEAAILNLKSGTYYGLDPVGARIWNLVHEPRTVNEVRDVILNEFDVEPERCERDVHALLQRLAAAGLIEVQGEKAG